MPVKKIISGGGTHPDGVQLGGTTAEKVSFHDQEPTAQVAHADQGAVTKTVGAAVATTAATNSTPYGYTTAAQADDIVTRLNQAIVDIGALETLVNRLRTEIVNKGIMKGAA